jgi:hypothetical protein
LIASCPAGAGVIGSDARRTLPEYVNEHGMPADQAWRRFAAGGRLICNRRLGDEAP